MASLPLIKLPNSLRFIPVGRAMETEVKKHYDTLLANAYSWMVGDFEARKQQQYAFFVQQDLVAQPESLALDLGSGHGLQSIALAELGYQVLAIDLSSQLLAELKQRAGDKPITTQQDDLLNLSRHVADHSVDLVCCMGDTLPHLASTDQVIQLFEAMYQVAKPGGHAVLSFRDMSTEPEVSPLVIPVRNDRDTIFTCVLTYFPTKVRVTDLIHRWVEDHWQPQASSYDKLRLSETAVVDWLQQTGWHVKSATTSAGMRQIVASK